MQPYNNLVLAGYGAMGEALCTLGNDTISRFGQIIVIDQARKKPAEVAGAVAIQGDVEDRAFLSSVLKGVQDDFLMVNLCSCTDNFRIRQVVSEYNGAYIDTSCSMIYGKDEYRYSRLMPYTFQPAENSQPHFVCCGINPGIVEIVTRMIIRDHFAHARLVDVHLFEYDDFHADLKNGKAAVSWSADTLIDETLLSPTFQIVAGSPREGESKPTHAVQARWQHRWIDSRLVGHEELYNFQFIEGVRIENSFYAYAMRRKVMDVLDRDPQYAQQHITLPAREVPVRGTDSVAVKVIDTATRKSRTFVWTTDHAWTYRKWKLNAVQFQVASSLLLFVELLLRSGVWARGKAFCASNLPIERFGWQKVRELLKAFGIEWHPADHLNLRIDNSIWAESKTNPKAAAVIQNSGLRS